MSLSGALSCCGGAGWLGRPSASELRSGQPPGRELPQPIACRLSTPLPCSGPIWPGNIGGLALIAIGTAPSCLRAHLIPFPRSWTGRGLRRRALVTRVPGFLWSPEAHGHPTPLWYRVASGLYFVAWAHQKARAGVRACGRAFEHACMRKCAHTHTHECIFIGFFHTFMIVDFRRSGAQDLCR